MLTHIKRSALQLLKSSGTFRRVHDSHWRQQRLLILCYHGISIDDEHEWRPALYMTSQQLESRLEMLKKGAYNVLPLGQALKRLQAGDLPNRSVVLTFDDGAYDFYARAYPLLKKYGFPATVYQTTYYSDLPRPVFNLACSYMLWKRRGEILNFGDQLGIQPELDLRTLDGRRGVMRRILAKVAEGGLSGMQCDEFAAKLAALLGVDYCALVEKRVLQLMNEREIAELAKQGVDFQLHTHRHRTPQNELLFRKEIRDNRDRLQQIAGSEATHFCYPSGVYEIAFLPWLAQENVVSATTCDVGFATRKSKPLLLPRFIDTTGTTALEFESWLTGVGQLLARSKTEEID